jgi:hypothetical protein
MGCARGRGIRPIKKGARPPDWLRPPGPPKRTTFAALGRLLVGGRPTLRGQLPGPWANGCVVAGDRRRHARA